MSSQNIRWYEHHKQTLRAVTNIIIEAIPGASPIKATFDLLRGIEDDKGQGSQEERLNRLEEIIATIKPHMQDVVDNIENLEEFRQASSPQEQEAAIYNSYIGKDLTQTIIPQLQTLQRPSLTSPPIFQQKILPKDKTLDNKYVIQEYLGGGGQGKVYKAQHANTGGNVALKVLNPEITYNPQSVKALKSEYLTLVDKLRHPSIVQYRDISLATEEGQWYVTMDYIPGSNLRSVMINNRRQPFDAQEVIKILSPIAEALEHAHEKNIVHCDIKPENILIPQDSSQLSAYLTDFGLFHEMKTILSATTNLHAGFTGTVPYMAPEQFKGKRPTPASDVWALAIIAYEMLAGVHPYYGTSFEHYQSLICQETPTPLQDKQRWHIIKHALEKDPHLRNVTPTQFIAELKAPQNVIVHGNNNFDENISEIDIEYIDKEEEKPNEYVQRGIELFNDQDFENAFKELCGWYFNEHTYYYLGWMYYHGKGTHRDYRKALEKFKECIENKGITKKVKCDASYWLGNMYLNGYYVEPSFKTAYKHFQESTQSSNASYFVEAHIILGNLHTLQEKAMKGFTRDITVSKKTPTDYEKAIEFYEKAAKAGNQDAMMKLAGLYLRGRNVFLNEYSENITTILNSSFLYKPREKKTIPLDPTQSYTKAKYWYEQSLINKPSEALLNIASIYATRYFYRSEGTEYDLEEAIHWYTKAAEMNNIDAMRRLGKLFMKPLCPYTCNFLERIPTPSVIIPQPSVKTYSPLLRTSPVSYESAFKWLKQAIILGECAESTYLLGLQCEQLNITTHINNDELDASDLYLRAATGLSYYAYAKYLDNYTSATDDSKKYYIKASEMGNTIATNKLGKLKHQAAEKLHQRCSVYRPDEIKKKYHEALHEALEYFEAAAELGNHIAMNNAAIIYKKLGCDQDSYLWRHKAAEAGNKQAIDLLDKFNASQKKKKGWFW